MEDTVSDIYNKLILKLDEKYDEEFYSKYSIGELLLSDYNYNPFIPPHHKYHYKIIKKCLCNNANNRKQQEKKD